MPETLRPVGVVVALGGLAVTGSAGCSSVALPGISLRPALPRGPLDFCLDRLGGGLDEMCDLVRVGDHRHVA